MSSYRERLQVPAGYWLIAIPVALTLGAEAYFFVDGWFPPVFIVALYGVMALFMLNWSSASVEITGSTLRAGKHTLDLSEADEVVALDERQAAAVRGPQADPAACLLLRPYLKRAVYISLTDPDKGVPYWLVATRRPEALAAAIESARRAPSSPAHSSSQQSVE